MQDVKLLGWTKSGLSYAHTVRTDDIYLMPIDRMSGAACWQPSSASIPSDRTQHRARLVSRRQTSRVRLGIARRAGSALRRSAARRRRRAARVPDSDEPVRGSTGALRPALVREQHRARFLGPRREGRGCVVPSDAGHRRMEDLSAPGQAGNREFNDVDQDRVERHGSRYYYARQRLRRRAIPRLSSTICNPVANGLSTREPARSRRFAVSSSAPIGAR